jgi:hypothetical protein
MFTTTIGGSGRPLNYKEAIQHDDPYWHYNAASGAWYGYRDDPAPPSPQAPSWNDTPSLAEDLEQAKAAARRTIALGYGQPRTRSDGKAPCMHCTKCDQGAYSRCHKPVEPIVAKATADQLQADRVTAAEAVAAANARVVWQQQIRLGMAV